VKRRRGRPVVVGVTEHSGWAILVSAAAVNGAPAVIDRRRVPLIEKGLPNLPYEHDTRALADDEAQQLLDTVKQSIAACAALALERLADDLWPQHRVSAIAIRQPPLPRLPATAREAHDSYHVLCRADGMLYHDALCKAARQRDWEVVFHRRGEELTQAADALQASRRDVERFITDQKRTLKAPWTTEHRHAFAAAIASLKRESRLRIPRIEL
jgi:hypothetical protein